KYPDAMLLFRVGDFYETFGQDAVTASNILGIVLTARNNGSSKIELAGFPHHSLDTYLPKLVLAGQRVAVCDQLEEASKTKKIVKRGVTELVTPGVALSDKVLEHKSNNFLAAVHFDKKRAGVSFLDISTGEFLVAEGNHEYIEKLIQGFRPSEILYQRNRDKEFHHFFGSDFYTYKLEDWVFTEDFSNETLLNHFGVKSLKGFGIEQIPMAIIAAGVALHYLSTTEHNRNQHISSIHRIEQEHFVWLDKFTIRNLELINSSNEGGISLISILDHTSTAMGARMLKRWMLLPLKEKRPIDQRLEVVKYFFDNRDDSSDLIPLLSKIGDLERMVSRLSALKITPRELSQLRFSLQSIQPIKTYCKNSNSQQLKIIGDHINDCKAAVEELAATLYENAPAVIGKGETIMPGVSSELDELRAISKQGKGFLIEMQKREAEKTGIPSLKIAYNNVFGYYIEVRNTHKDKVPQEWIRKQTLTAAERYITEELKEYETKILGAEQKILEIEISLYNALIVSVSNSINLIQQNAQLIGKIDCLLSFAKVALTNNYCCPTINEGFEIDIKQGRHPVIEQHLPLGENYIPNDVLLNTDKQQIMMITGPNMSGKSALLRQTALIVIMAQMGCYVPAESAVLGITDKVFTRVGASDNISSGESTFMVEMNETASILNNISNRSLILLDEIGRGTSTYDGISIAWAIAEYIHQLSKIKAKTLFATHYHELNDMTLRFPRIKNFNVSVQEIKKKIVFLRKLKEGGSEHSFGIHVAKVAGMPKEILKRAQEILVKLEKSHAADSKPKVLQKDDSEMQLSFFKLDDPVLSQIKTEITKIDIDTLTPIEALMKLNEIKKLVGG
ncbi:DNA mismatch repair protein MutS, partial [Flavobacteriales bacterium]|nr:DNA mismatch repair protein MutS [Flavobacteriales bacterium]